MTNRIVWIARLIALLMLLTFAVVMMNLHGKLRRLQSNQPVVTTPR